MSLQKLVPVKVPWKITSATPFLTVRVAEFEPEMVSFIALFNTTNGMVERRVTVTFNEIVLIGLRTGNESPPIDESEYDWSNTLQGRQQNGNFDLKYEEFEREWISSGYCPDPHMYKVLNSKWTIPYGNNIGMDYTHYLFVGEMTCMDVLAKGWKWEAGDIIDWK